jgi:predicted nucleotidyltransferase
MFDMKAVKPKEQKRIFDISRFAAELSHQFPDVLFAYLFGSAQTGTIRPGGDVDLAVWVRDTSKKIDLIPALTGLVESFTDGTDCDLVFLNDAGDQLAFEILNGRKLFVRPEAIDLHAGFYSQTCREYEDRLAWMKKQLQYRGYEVQWGD